jgi:hypothetical protein
VRRLAAPLVIALLVAGCGGKSERDQVRAYVDQANAIERQSAPALQKANVAYAAFSRGQLKGADAAAAFATSEATLRSIRGRVAALDPPAKARTLHATLLRSLDANLELAGESTALARYTPAARAVATKLTSAASRLRAKLRTAKTPAAQAAALKTYAASLGAAGARLRALTPPPILASSQKAQLARLDDVRALAGKLRTAIAARDSVKVAKLLIRFRRAGSGGPSAASLSRKALQAYDKRYADVARAGQAVRREEAALERSLG